MIKCCLIGLLSWGDVWNLLEVGIHYSFNYSWANLIWWVTGRHTKQKRRDRYSNTLFTYLFHQTIVSMYFLFQFSLFNVWQLSYPIFQSRDPWIFQTLQCPTAILSIWKVKDKHDHNLLNVYLWDSTFKHMGKKYFSYLKKFTVL